MRVEEASPAPSSRSERSCCKAGPSRSQVSVTTAMSASISLKQSISESIFGVRERALVFISVNSFFFFRSSSSRVKALSNCPSSSESLDPMSSSLSYGPLRPSSMALPPEAAAFTPGLGATDDEAGALPRPNPADSWTGPPAVGPVR